MCELWKQWLSKGTVSIWYIFFEAWGKICLYSKSVKGALGKMAILAKKMKGNNMYIFFPKEICTTESNEEIKQGYGESGL